MAIYFSHDEDARNDSKIIKLRVKYGMEGYGCYFAMLEMMSAEKDHTLEYGDELFDALEYDFRTSFTIKAFVDRCIEIGLFQSDGRKMWSDSFDRRMREAEERSVKLRERAMKAASVRWSKQRGEQAPEPPISSPIALGFDNDWIAFAETYERNIGMIPHGGSKAGQVLLSYYDDMGAAVMCKAIEITSLAAPDNREQFLRAILKDWADKNVKTVEDADRVTQEHEQKKKKAVSAGTNRTEKRKQDGTEIGGKFY